MGGLLNIINHSTNYSDHTQHSNTIIVEPIINHLLVLLVDENRRMWVATNPLAAAAATTIYYNGRALNFLMSHNLTLRNNHLTIELQHCLFMLLLSSWTDGNGMTSGIIIIMRARCNDVNDRPQGIPPPPPTTVDNNNDDNGRGWAGLGLTNRPPGKTINIDTICRGWPCGLNGESKSLFTRIWLIKNHIYIRSLSSSSSSSYSRLNISEPTACTQSSPT